MQAASLAGVGSPAGIPLRPHAIVAAAGAPRTDPAAAATAGDERLPAGVLTAEDEQATLPPQGAAVAAARDLDFE